MYIVVHGDLALCLSDEDGIAAPAMTDSYEIARQLAGSSPEFRVLDIDVELAQEIKRTHGIWWIARNGMCTYHPPDPAAAQAMDVVADLGEVDLSDFEWDVATD